MYEVTILRTIPNPTQDEFNFLVSFVSLEKRERISKFHFMSDAWNCLLGDILARIKISQFTGLNNKQLEFSINSYGKPIFINKPYVHYNISHAGHYVAFIIANEPVGIDIELIKSMDLKVAKRFFAPDEIEYIFNNNQMHRFYEVWTKKESHLKWEGIGLNKPLSSFSVINASEKENIYYHNVFYNNETICHVCSGKKDKPSVKVIDTITLMKNIKFMTT